jgi:hypothetical protein
MDTYYPRPPVIALTSTVHDIQDDIDNKEASLEKEICEGVQLDDGLSELHSTLMQYKTMFMLLLDKPVSPQAYFSDDQNNPGSHKFCAIFKLGDPLWLGAEEDQGLRTYAVPKLEHQDYELLVSSCYNRGGMLPEANDLQSYNELINVCQPSQLNCGRVMAHVKAAGCELVWGGSGKVINMDWSDNFKLLFCNKNSSYEFIWNENPLYVAANS